MITVYVKHFGQSKFTQINRFPTLSPSKPQDLETVRAWIAKTKTPNSSSTWQIRSGTKTTIEVQEPTTDRKAVEPVVGQNEQMLRHMLGKLHVGEPMLGVLRYVIRERMTMPKFRKIPRQLRRGLIQEVCKIHTANRKLYSDVMGGNL